MRVRSCNTSQTPIGSVVSGANDNLYEIDAELDFLA